MYTAGIFGNSGNYKSFGDTKIVPGVSLAKLEALVHGAKFQSMTEEQLETKWKAIRDSMYSLSDREKQLGLGDKVSSKFQFFSNLRIADCVIAGHNNVLFEQLHIGGC